MASKSTHIAYHDSLDGKHLTDPTHDEAVLPFHVNHHKQPSSTLRRVFIVLAALGLLTVFTNRCGLLYNSFLPETITDADLLRNPAYLVRAEHGAVATENRRCSDIGVQVLKDGGNAVDAAVSAVLCVGVVNMFSSGLAGGGFMVVRLPPSSPNDTSEVYSIDFRETAPAASNATMFQDEPINALIGGLASGVPGELRGLQEAHKRWGRLPWSRLVRPSVDLAAGWYVDPELARRIKMFAPIMLYNAQFQPVFAPKGKLLVEGDSIKRTNLSRTLAIIAEEGPDAFYNGPIADSIVRAARKAGGILTNADMEKYSVRVNNALRGTYNGKVIYTTHAPTSGPALLHMFNLLEHYDLAGEGRTALNLHRILEAMKCITKIGDPPFSENSTARIDEVMTKSFAAAVVANLTDDETHPPQYYNPEFDIKTDHGTSQTSVVDSAGMAVSLTSTINGIFGSLVLDPETGVILNNEMDDFSTPGSPNGDGLRPSPYNYPAPGKRPLSSCVPTIMENSDGSIHLVTGGSGGSKIFGAVFQTILNVEWGQDVGSAIEYGRVHNQLLPEVVEVDSILPEEYVEELRERGHMVKVRDINRIAAVVQAIHVKDGIIFAASDSRKNGIAAGY
ncbi:gamma-glutamyltranspeptidase [Coniophora puteana RWD-64-598 SS2]|uniref:Glutathione hydrolase n=1 Tax=Coniophora puteana (strain RWD-64-598) TaxID=741705 RepID=A0A5M3MV32_CONPW|nr:gamma-glutamyltranspeptidase [Coniophora puteana RWD-64-598 SS2]EIW83028.1 gamma-glutamyltranspeptidase [Coniophora puteana RWD-64-598 SS2]